jgi:hypothetical protein
LLLCSVSLRFNAKSSHCGVVPGFTPWSTICRCRARPVSCCRGACSLWGSFVGFPARCCDVCRRGVSLFWSCRERRRAVIIAGCLWGSYCSGVPQLRVAHISCVSFGCFAAGCYLGSHVSIAAVVVHVRVCGVCDGGQLSPCYASLCFNYL